tara:strand:+ start:87416 stop:89566 length:2151 start_codon:yes stop_codon:yes gene_type:complete
MEKCISDSLLFQYLVNELDAELSELVTAHLNHCASCQKRTEIFSEDNELREWHECHQRRENDETSKSYPFSQDRLDLLFNSTISSIHQSAARTPQHILPTGEIPPSNQTSSISIGKELNLKPIRTIGQYQLIKKIGQGGMGIVYLAIHSRLKKKVVLKLLLNKDWDNANQIQRFYREMQLVGQLDHPNIVRATDAGEADDTCFLVMEYLAGHDLKSLLKSEGKVSVTAACSIIRQAANGLQSIHNSQLIHRDIKPSNLFLTADGQVKILDLGLAGLSHSEASFSDLTDSNCIMGSAYYMAPEQAQSVKTIDQRSDIYSLGCTFYQLLTGQVPIRKDTPVETIIAHREEPAPRLSAQLPDIPEELEELFQSMIQKDAEDRIQTMAEVVQKLDEFLAHQSNLPVNDTSDTYLDESQELKQLCLNADLTPAVEALNHYSSTQYQPSSRFFNKYKIRLLTSGIILLGVGLLSLFLVSDLIPESLRPDSIITKEPLKINEPSPAQAQLERKAAIWALNHGCVLIIHGAKKEINQIESLPAHDFYLKSISFKPQTINSEAMLPFQGLSKLENLFLNDCLVADDALDPIQGFISLKKLDLHDTGITDKGLSHISGLKNLTHLSLQKNHKLTDEGLQILNQFHNLVSVNLARLNISDTGIHFIQNNPNLEWLNISETGVTDQSVKYLKTLRRMDNLFLHKSRITEEGSNELRTAFPDKNPIKSE